MDIKEALNEILNSPNPRCVAHKTVFDKCVEIHQALTRFAVENVEEIFGENTIGNIEILIKFLAPKYLISNSTVFTLFGSYRVSEYTEDKINNNVSIEWIDNDIHSQINSNNEYLLKYFDRGAVFNTVSGKTINRDDFILVKIKGYSEYMLVPIKWLTCTNEQIQNNVRSILYNHIDSLIKKESKNVDYCEEQLNKALDKYEQLKKYKEKGCKKQRA